MRYLDVCLCLFGAEIACYTGRNMPRNNRVKVRNMNASEEISQKLESDSQPEIPLNVLYFIECSESGISEIHVETLEQVLRDVEGQDQLYLVLHTFGGDVYSAVRIMHILQSKFKRISILIPDYAYSSGTIMSLGSDEIYMAIDATIGPLDKPLENLKDGSSISSLDITQLLPNLASICSSTAAGIYSQMRNEMKLPKLEAAKLAFNTAAKIIIPIVDKIDPFNLQSGFRQSKIGLFYAIDMLGSRMMKGNTRQAIETSRRLVNNYPSHGYCIFRDEAKFSLKLNIHMLENLTEWQRIELKFKILKASSTNVVNYQVI